MHPMTRRALLALALLAPLVAHAGYGLGERGPVLDLHLAAMQVADFDGDGHADIVGLADGYHFGKLAFARGNGDGTFQAPSFFEFGVEALHLTSPGPQLELADLDGDGDLDVVVTTMDAGGRVYLLRNDNDGFAATFRDTGFATGWLMVAKVDGDIIPDVVVQAYSWDPAATVFHGDGAAGIRTTSALPLPPGQWGAIDMVDLDGNGRKDLVYRAGGGLQAHFHDGQALAGTPTLLLDPESTGYDSHALRRKFTFGDFNADGRIDVLPVACDGCLVRLWLQQPDGSFEPLGRVPGFSGEWRVADLDGDGLDDLFAPDGLRLVARLGRGDGTFLDTAFHTTGAVAPSALIVEDVNGDGVADVVTSRWDGTAATLGRLQAEGVDVVLDATVDATGVELRLRNHGTRASSAYASLFLAAIPRDGTLTPGNAPEDCDLYDGSAFGRGLEVRCNSIPSLLPGEELRVRLPFLVRWDADVIRVRIRGIAKTDLYVDIHPENNELDMTGTIIRPTPSAGRLGGRAGR